MRLISQQSSEGVNAKPVDIMKCFDNVYSNIDKRQLHP